jgi:hypothetical protein
MSEHSKALNSGTAHILLIFILLFAPGRWEILWVVE